MSDTYVDPLERVHSCDHGWQQVKPPYAEHIARAKAEPDTDAYRVAYAALINSYYPCSTCRPQQFYRWAKGHWSKDHDPATCAECVTLRRGKAAGREVEQQAPPELRERRDLQ